MFVIDQFSREIVGFAVHEGRDLGGGGMCCMFNQIHGSSGSNPKYLSTDNDPLFKFHLWEVNLDMAGINEIKSVPNIPLSHPFVERQILSVRQDFSIKLFFWNGADLLSKLSSYRDFFNKERVHYAHEGKTPMQVSEETSSTAIDLTNYRLQKTCRGLYQLPVAA